MLVASPEGFVPLGAPETTRGETHGGLSCSGGFHGGQHELVNHLPGGCCCVCWLAAWLIYMHRPRVVLCVWEAEGCNVAGWFPMFAFGSKTRATEGDDVNERGWLLCARVFVLERVIWLAYVVIIWGRYLLGCKSCRFKLNWKESSMLEDLRGNILQPASPADWN